MTLLPPEADGLVADVYNALWECRTQTSTFRDIDIPETVLFEQGWPKTWFKTVGPKGRRRTDRMSHHEISMHAIFQSLVEGARRREIVAELCYGRFDPNQEHFVLSVEYLTKEGLEEFFHARCRGLTCVLQQFIYPKGAYNTVLQGAWSPNGVLVSTRQNRHTMTQASSLSMTDRCVTFDGPQHESQWGVVTPYQKERFFTAMNQFASALSTVDKMKLIGLVAFYKIGDDGRIYLLRCTAVRTQQGEVEAGPVDLNVVFCEPSKPRCIVNIPVRLRRNRHRLHEIGVTAAVEPVGTHSVDLESIHSDDLDPLDSHVHSLYCAVASHSDDKQANFRLPHRECVVNPKIPWRRHRTSRAHPVRKSEEPEEIPTPPRRSGSFMTRSFRRKNHGFLIDDTLRDRRNALYEFLQDMCYRAHWHQYNEGRQRYEDGFESLTFSFPHELAASMRWDNLQECQARIGLEHSGALTSDGEAIFTFVEGFLYPSEEVLRSVVMLFYPVHWMPPTPSRKNQINTIRTVDPDFEEESVLAAMSTHTREGTPITLGQDKMTPTMTATPHPHSPTMSPRLRSPRPPTSEFDDDETPSTQPLQPSSARGISLKTVVRIVSPFLPSSTPNPAAVAAAQNGDEAMLMEPLPPPTHRKPMGRPTNRWKIESCFPVLKDVKPPSQRQLPKHVSEASVRRITRSHGVDQSTLFIDSQRRFRRNTHHLRHNREGSSFRLHASSDHHQFLAPEMEYWLQGEKL
eukprot:PhM_4_TR10107/c0_g1_i1/m.85252